MFDEPTRDMSLGFTVPVNPAYCTRPLSEQIALAGPPPALTRATTALVVVDMINSMFPWKANTPLTGNDALQQRVEQVVIPNTQRLLAAFRAFGAPIVFLNIGALRPDYADTGNGMRRVLTQAGDAARPSAVIDELSVEQGDMTVIKTGSGGFISGGLDSHLRNMGIRTIMYTGVVTNGCVLLTLGGGFDLGYYGFLIEDATASRSLSIQEAAVGIATTYSLPVSTADVIEELGRLSAYDDGDAPARNWWMPEHEMVA